MRRTFFLLLAGLALMLSACSGSDSPTGNGEPPGSASGEIGPAGGVLTIETATGAGVSLAFAALAIGTPTVVTIEEVATAGDDWLEVRLSPAGLRLGQPVRIVVTPPDGVMVDDLTTLQFGPSGATIPVATEVDPVTGELSAELWTLGFADESGTASKLEPVGTLTATSATCQARVLAAQAALDIMLDVADYKRALQLYGAYTSLAEESQCGPDWEAWLSTAGTVACNAYNEARVNAQALVPEDYGDFYDIATPLVYWASTLTYFDASCENLTSWEDLLAEKFEQFLIFYEPVVDGVLADDIDTIRRAREEVQRLYAMYGELSSLGLSDEALELGEQKIRPLLDALRTKAYAHCHEDQNHYFLTKMTYAGFLAGTDVLPIGGAPGLVDKVGESLLFASFADADIHRDLQYCASCLGLDYVVDGDVWGELHVGGGAAPGEETATGEIWINETGIGKLVLECEIFRLVCFPPSQNADDLLRIVFEDTLIETLGPTSAPALFTGGLEYTIETLMTASGTTIAPGQEYVLEVWRDREACDNALFGESSVKLFEILVRTGT